MVAPTAHITTLKGNPQLFLNLREKKANFDACLTPRRWARLDNPGSNIFAGVFFLLLKERKCITATLFMIFLFFN
jgi:hypothetical protein